MNGSDNLYTAGIWTVRQGKEADFITVWEQFARWTAEHQPGAAQAYILQDIAHPQRFLTFGPWQSIEEIEAWRSTDEFRAFVGRAHELCEHFQPGTFRVISRVSPPEVS